MGGSCGIEQRGIGLEVMVVITELMAKHHQAFGVVRQGIFPSHANPAV